MPGRLPCARSGTWRRSTARTTPRRCVWRGRSAELDPGDTAGLNIAAFAHNYDAGLWLERLGWGQSFMAANEVARKAVSIDPP